MVFFKIITKTFFEKYEVPSKSSGNLIDTLEQIILRSVTSIVTVEESTDFVDSSVLKVLRFFFFIFCC